MLAVIALAIFMSQVVVMQRVTGVSYKEFRPRFSRRGLQRLVVPSLSAFFLFFSSNIVLLHGTRVIIDGMFGPATLAGTTAISIYFRSIRFVMSIIPHGLQVELGLLLHRRDAQRSSLIISRLSSTTATVAFGTSLGAFAFAQYILPWWIPGVHLDWCILTAVCVGASVGCLFDFWSTLLSSVNRIGWLASAQFVSSVACFCGISLIAGKASICVVLGITAVPDVVGVVAAIVVTKAIIESPTLTLRALFVMPAREVLLAARNSIARIAYMTRA